MIRKVHVSNYLIGLIFIFIFSCKPTENVVSPSVLYEVHYNVLYGKDSTQQILDYYLPTIRDEKNTPIVIMLHGGAWIQGNKTDFDVVGLYSLLTSYGLAIVNMNYRLDRTYPYPAPLDDIDSVMEFVRKKANEWHVNPNRVCMLGRSSGAHLALLYAYSRNIEKRIRGVIECSGPVNFTDSSVVDATLGLNVTVWLGNYNTHKQLWHDASPIYYMKNALPTVILQGLADQLVLPVQAQMLQDSLNARGMPCMYVGWPNSGHGWNLQLWPQVKDETVIWIKNFL